MTPDDRNSNFDDKDNRKDDDDLFSHYSSRDDDDFKEPDFKEPDFDDDRNQPFKERERGGKEKEDMENEFFKDSDFEFRNYEDEEYDVNGVRDEKVRSRKRRRKVIVSTILIMAILVVVAIGIVFGYRFIKNKYFTDETTATTGTGQPIVVPSDLKLGNDLSIAIAFAGDNLVEPELNSVFFSKYIAADSEMITLSIPINALMEIPGFGLDSIDKSVEFGGMDLLKLTLKNTLGMDVNNYMLMDIVNVVNKLEGMNLQMEEDTTITAVDGSAIELKKGDNIINGDDALSYMSYYSGTTADVPISSVSKQKILLDSLAIKIIGEKEGDLAKNLAKINDYIETDLNLEELSELISTMAGLEDEKNKSYALEGDTVELEGSIFYVPDVTKIGDIFNQENLPADGEEPVTTGETYDVSVLNGVGVKGIAGKTGDLLKLQKYGDGKAKFEVTAGDADNYNYTETLIILKSDDPALMAAAEDIKSLLQAGKISTQEGTAQTADIVVTVGKDFDYDAAAAAVSATTSTEETSASTDTTGAEDVVYDVNVLNGEGTQGIALTVQGILEEDLNKDKTTIKVKEAKNADNFGYTQTKIITHTDKSGIQDMANKIKEVLGVGAVSSSKDNPDNVDITVIIGSDYTK